MALGITGCAQVSETRSPRMFDRGAPLRISLRRPLGSFSVAGQKKPGTTLVLRRVVARAAVQALGRRNGRPCGGEIDGRSCRRNFRGQLAVLCVLARPAGMQHSWGLGGRTGQGGCGAFGGWRWQSAIRHRGPPAYQKQICVIRAAQRAMQALRRIGLLIALVAALERDRNRQRSDRLLARLPVGRP